MNIELPRPHPRGRNAEGNPGRDPRRGRQAVCQRDSSARHHRPGDALLLKMMRACLGENVAPEYAPLMREEMGFVPPRRDRIFALQPCGFSIIRRVFSLALAPV
jgi:hypothetical protein